MDAIIELLKARRARSAAMLHPGGTSGRGSGLFLNSSSLRPQTVFRETKSSFSVKQPSMTVMRASSFSSFSKKADHYSNGMALLHLRPASSAANSAVQRSFAPMPLPAVGGAASPAVSEVPASVPGPMSSAPAYPPKSERRPVMFEKTDGPSDIEKRIMAAKKQKQAQAEKAKGPDRRRVRTERVEISSGGSQEVNRDFAPFDLPVSEPPSTPDNIVRREIADRSVTPAPAKPAAAARPNPVRHAAPPPAAVDTLQRESFSEPEAGHSAEPNIPAALPQFAQPSAAPQMHHAERPGDPITNTDPAADVVHREINEPAAAAPVSRPASPAENIAQREPLPAAAPVSRPTSPTENIAQREPLLAAAPVSQPAPAAENIAQREPLPAAASVSQPAPAAKNIAQREPLPAAQPVSQPAPAAGNSAQREPLSAASQPASPQTPVSSEMRSASDPLVQREFSNDPSTEIAAQEHKPAAPMAQPTAEHTVRREVLKASPVRSVQQIAANTNAAAASVPAAVVRREINNGEPVTAIPAAAPISEENRAAPAENTIRRDPLPSAHPVDSTVPETIQQSLLQDPDQPEAGSSGPDTVQRESGIQPTGEDAMHSDRQASSANVPEPAPTVQREALPIAEPVSRPALQPDMPLPEYPADQTANVQREFQDPSSDEEPQSISTAPAAPAKAAPAKAAPAKAAPVKVQKATSSPAAAVPVQREMSERPAPAKPVSNAAPLIRREPEDGIRQFTDDSGPSREASSFPQVRREVLKAAAPLKTAAKSPEMPVSTTDGSSRTVRREPLESAVTANAAPAPSADLHALLQGLPTHYEMPPEQIAAIRSGKSAAASSASQQSTVQREMAPEAERSLPSAAVQGTVRRETDMVLPKFGGNTVVHTDPEPTVRREWNAPFTQPASPTRQSAAGSKSGSSSRQSPGRQNSSSGTTLPLPFGGVRTNDVVQREPLESADRESPVSPETDANDEMTVDNVIEQFEDSLPEVTARDLELLADKLVPRIKRMMRAEMERSIFR